MRILLFISLFIPLYTYLLYPLILFLICRSRDEELAALNTGEATGCSLPYISILLAVHNEAERLQGKLEELRRIEYPDNLRELIVVADACSDSSVELLRGYPEVTLIELTERCGKERALRQAAAQAKGEILCLTDVAATVESTALRRIAELFCNPRIGAVSSVDTLESDSRSLEGIHVAFEMFIRAYESRLGSAIGMSGSFFAVRRSVFAEVELGVCSDLAAALQCARMGYRAITAPSIQVRYRESVSAEQEYHRKTRTLVHGFNTVFQYRDLLNPIKYPAFSWQLWSHKALRWLSVLSAPLAVALLIFQLNIFALLLSLLLLIVLLLLCRGVRERLPSLKNVLLAVLYPAAVLRALCCIARGERFDVWQPTRRV